MGFLYILPADIENRDRTQELEKLAFSPVILPLRKQTDRHTDTCGGPFDIMMEQHGEKLTGRNELEHEQ